MTTSEIIKFLTDQKEYIAAIKIQEEIIRKLNEGEMAPRPSLVGEISYLNSPYATRYCISGPNYTFIVPGTHNGSFSYTASVPTRFNNPDW